MPGLVEGFVPRLARVLRRIRVTFKQELKDRITAARVPSSMVLQTQSSRLRTFKRMN
jgi:hypothetical protein